MKITASQARLVLSGGKTAHRVRATIERAPYRVGKPVKLRPELEGRVVVLDAVWITADWLDARTMRAEGFKTPLAMKLDWVERYDAAWLRKVMQDGDVYDDETLTRRFAQRWASAPAWLLTLEPIAAERHLMPAARPRSSELGYSDRIVSGDLGPASPSIDPLEAGEAVDRGTLERFARDAALRRTEHQRDADTERRLVPLEQQLADLRADAAARGVDIALHEASIQRRIDAARKRVERRAA